MVMWEEMPLFAQGVMISTEERSQQKSKRPLGKFLIGDADNPSSPLGTWLAFEIDCIGLVLL